jgi:hypothetical protein
MNSNLLQNAIDEIGQRQVATACGLTYQAVRKWRVKGLPRTEWTGETNYAETIERLSAGKYSRDDLLTFSEQMKRSSTAKPISPQQPQL